MDINLSPVCADGVWFAPTFMENRELSDDQRMALRLLPLTGRELKQLRSGAKTSIKPKKESDFLLLVEEREEKLTQSLLKSKIAEVRNLTARDETGTKKPIQTGEAFVEMCMSGPPELLRLLEEVLQALLDSSKLDEGAIKN